MAATLNLNDSVSAIKGVGDKKQARLEALEIMTVGDLLRHYPYRYMDRRNVVPAMSAIAGRDSLVQGVLKSKHLRKLSGRRSVLECMMSDGSCSYAVVFFNMPFLQKQLDIGTEYVIWGRLSISNGLRKWTNPEIAEAGSSKDVRGIIPVYRCTKGITSRDLSKLALYCLDNLEPQDEWIDEQIVSDNRLCDEEYAIRNIHFPKDEHHYKVAKYRLIYEQLLAYQMAVRLSRLGIENAEGDASIAPIENIEFLEFTKSLPFELTSDQLKTIEEIREDLADSRPMNRLVQGDVGCGKTAVSEAAIYMNARAGHQSAMMAPTEILARQHYEKLRNELGKLGIRCELLVSGIKSSERKVIMEDLASGKIDCIIGTHALIQSDVSMSDLTLAITDEQHRFGVNQRKTIAGKGSAVNVMVMSATPIPRTLQATVFGDMDFSIIHDKPAKRLKIITRAITPDSRSRAYVAVRDELERGHKAYVVCPSIESEDGDMTSVNRLYEQLLERFRGYSVGLLHGRMDRREKESVMNDFASGRINLLVATVVVEVGIDVPDASIIVIENSERFGLSQLHQLRGRVGRSSIQSYCYLINYSRSEVARERAKLMTQIDDGFELSEEDYRLRGPGDIAGTMQHGMVKSGIIQLARYNDILEKALSDAELIISKADDDADSLMRQYERVTHLMEEMSDNRDVI